MYKSASSKLQGGSARIPNVVSMLDVSKIVPSLVSEDRSDCKRIFPGVVKDAKVCSGHIKI